MVLSAGCLVVCQLFLVFCLIFVAEFGKANFVWAPQECQANSCMSVVNIFTAVSMSVDVLRQILILLSSSERKKDQLVRGLLSETWIFVELSG